MKLLKYLSFLLIASFWVAMNVLLWRAEYANKQELISPVPAEFVWQKMLSAPDDSMLEVLHQGKKIGYVRWLPNVGDEIATGKVLAEEGILEGMVRKISGYTVDLEGNVLVEEGTRRIKFDVHIIFDTNLVWQEFELNTTLRPTMWKIRGSAITQKIEIGFRSGDLSWKHAFRFADLLNSGPVLEMLGVPFLSALAPAANTRDQKLKFGLEWSARQDWFKVGTAKVRSYNLDIRILEDLHANIISSKVGEVLRVELPGNVRLHNEAFLQM